MSVAALLNFDDPLYDFEHQMVHRDVLAVMSPLNRFSALPYFVEPWPVPPPQFPTPANMWNLDHQQAHNDFTLNLPAFPNEPVGFGIPLSQNLIDSDWNNLGSRSWIVFANHQEHYIASNAIQPLLPAGMWPFW